MLDAILYVGDNSDIPTELLKQFYHTFHLQVGVDLSCSCGTASILQEFYNISKLQFHFLLGSLLSDHKALKLTNVFDVILPCIVVNMWK